VYALPYIYSFKVLDASGFFDFGKGFPSGVLQKFATGASS